MKIWFVSLALGWALYLAGGLQPAAALVFGPDAEAPGAPLDIIVAVVDDDVITRHELDAAIQQVERRAGRKGQTLPPRPALEQQALENLILTKLQLRAAERSGIVVDDATLNTALENLARQNNLTLSQLRETLEKDGVSFADAREQIRREILFTRLRQRVVDSAIEVPEQEVDTLLTQSAGAAAGPQYRLAHILITAPKNANPADIEAAERKARQAAKQLSQGADFERLAAAVSDDRQAAREGGDLGWRTAGQLPPIYAQAAARLQPGQVSEVMRSPIGFHIVKLLDVREPGADASGQPTADAGEDRRSQAREAIFKRRVEEEWSQWLRRLRDEAYVEIRLPKPQAAP